MFQLKREERSRSVLVGCLPAEGFQLMGSIGTYRRPDRNAFVRILLSCLNSNVGVL